MAANSQMEHMALGNGGLRVPPGGCTDDLDDSVLDRAKTPVDLERIRRAVREILLAVGEDPGREGLRDTPDRVARMYAEVFNGLHQDEFDDQHDCDEGQRIGQDGGDVEQLESKVDLETDAVGAAEQLDHQDDLPDQRDARPRRGGQIGLQLRQDDVAQTIAPIETDPRMSSSRKPS